MKSILTIAFAALLLASFSVPATGQAVATQGTSASVTPVRVMTYNIRYNNPDDGRHAWPHRVEHVASTIRFHKVDLLGVQEALEEQLDDLADRLPDYRWFGVGRDDGKEAGEYTAIFYRPDRFEVLNQKTFWLSETPEVVGSRSWDAAITRIATWAEMRDKQSGRRFFLFNTHFDHRGVRAREESARLLARRVAEIAGSAPVIVTGDFNFDDTTEAYGVMAAAFDDTRHTARYGHHGPEGTFTGFKVKQEPGPRIDYIFTRNGVRALYHATLSEQWDGDYASDHLPVLAEVEFGQE